MWPECFDGICGGLLTGRVSLQGADFNMSDRD
jgi:hypothetical protein